MAMGESAKSESSRHVTGHDSALRARLPARFPLPERARVSSPPCARGAGHGVTDACGINRGLSPTSITDLY